MGGTSLAKNDNVLYKVPSYLANFAVTMLCHILYITVSILSPLLTALQHGWADLFQPTDQQNTEQRSIKIRFMNSQPLLENIYHRSTSKVA
jgi:hypothetical protein